MKNLIKWILKIKPFTQIKSEIVIYYSSKENSISLTEEEEKEIDFSINQSFTTSVEARYWYEDFFLKVADRITSGKHSLLYSLSKHVGWLTYSEYLEFTELSKNLEKSLVMKISNMTQEEVEKALQKREYKEQESVQNNQEEYYYSQLYENDTKKVIH